MNKKQIVIIDDEKDVMVYLATLLKDNGFEPHTAANGAEGLELIRSLRPDLVCLDILMPGQTGASLYKIIKNDKETKDIPVLVVSGLNLSKKKEEDSEAFRDINPDAYIEKPIRPAEFVETVRRLVA